MSTDPSNHNRNVPPRPLPPGQPVPPTPSPNYYPPLPPPAPQLPDFQPKGMKPVDKILAWTAAFAVLIFCMIVAAHYLLKPATVVVKPAATATHSAAATAHKVALTCKK